MKLAIIKTIIPNNANCVLFDFERLYTIGLLCALLLTLELILLPFILYRNAKIAIIDFVRHRINNMSYRIG